MGTGITITSLFAALMVPSAEAADCHWNIIGESFPAIQYSGGWETWLEEDLEEYSGSQVVAGGEYLGGGSVTLPFMGSGIAWYSNGTGVPASSLAIVDVSIDGDWVATVDLADFTWNGASQVVYLATDLGPGPHILRLDNVAYETGWGSWYGWLIIDHFEVLTECLPR